MPNRAKGYTAPYPAAGSSLLIASIAEPSPGVEVIPPQIAPDNIIQFILKIYLPIIKPEIMAIEPIKTEAITRVRPGPDSELIA